MSEALFEKLDAELPLALLPVRLEARHLPRKDPTHLCIRIFPDTVHADGHRAALTKRELASGQSYWRSIWATTDEAQISQARAWLASQSTPYRALWIATATTPTNLDAPKDPEPVFPKVEVDDTPSPVRAALLPTEWMVRLYDANMSLAHTTFSEEIDPDLVMAPSLSGTGIEAVHPKTGEELPPPLAFLAGQDLLWTVDFDLAVDAGMGVRIPIADVPSPVGALIVLGVRAGEDPVQEAGALDSLLEAHWYTRGLDAVPQGTPTNNTDAGRSGVSLSSPDIDELFELELGERPMAPLGRSVLLQADPALLYRLPAADVLSLATGRLRRNTFDRVAHADWAEGAVAWAMNIAIGYATVGAYINGPFATSDGETFIGGEAPTLRDWYADWARGGALLPVVRCGEQPYGLLPITHRPEQHFVAEDFDQDVEHHVHELRTLWEAAMPVAALDPNATDSMPSGTETGDAGIIAEVLGAVPHPTELRLRSATNHLEADLAAFYDMRDRLQQESNGDNLFYHQVHLDGESTITAAWENGRKRYIFGLPDDQPPLEPLNLTAQLVHVDLFAQEVQQAIDNADYLTTGPRIIDIIDNELRPLLQVYQEAVDAVPAPLVMWATLGGLGRSDMINLTATTFDGNTVPVVDLITTDGDIVEIRELIERAIDKLTTAQAAGTPPLQRLTLLTPSEMASSPLLVHLINVTYATVPVDDIGRVIVALRVLLAMIDSPAVTDPEEQLTLFLRESLGIAMYRLDAWITSLAAKRLAERRRAHPTGLQIGGFGWLLDLAQSDDPASQGFIHAPSLTQATTAAVLRSGWNAYGTADGDTPLSIDLASRRVRGAQWILDAVRNGQDLAELLGARFERSLHDRFLDEWIEKVRVLALNVRSLNREPSSPVDGLLVARSAAGVDMTEQEENLRDDLEAMTVPTADPIESERRDGVRDAWRALASDLDAVADLTMAQAVHSLIQGNDAAASAVMAVTGGGDAAVPRIDVTATQRDAQLVHHRVVATWPAPKAPPTDAGSALRAAEPRLTRWLEGVLPRVGDISARFEVLDATGSVVASGDVSPAGAGLTAFEAATLAAAAPTQGGSRLARLLAAHIATEHAGADPVKVEVDTSRASAGGVSVDEFGLIATALMQLLGRARPLRSADLAPPWIDTTTLPGFDAGELAGRVSIVETRLTDLLEAVRLRGRDRTAALVDCAVMRVHGALRALESGASDESVAEIVTALKTRLLPPDDPDDDPIRAHTARLRALTGEIIPILPVFVPAADPDRVTSANSPTRRRHAIAEAPAWLRQVARVRPDLSPLIDFVVLDEAATGSVVGPFGLAEVPHTNGPWAAIERPDDDRDRLSIVSLTGPAGLAVKDQPVAGLFLDGWTEGIPRRMIQTGIAVHFDAPTARPPQTILLSVVDDERRFSADELSDQLLHTIELSKLRAVGPSDLPDIGHYLPAVLLPEFTTVSGGAR